MADEQEPIQVEVTFLLPEEDAEALKSIKEVLGIPVPDQLRLAAEAHVATQMSAPDFEERLERFREQSDADITRLLEVSNRR